jgi:hypothetical protein
MPIATFKLIGGLELRSCFMGVGLVDGTTTTTHVGMVRDMMINIEGFELLVDVIATKDNEDQNCPLISGRLFMTTAKTLVDLEQKEVFIRSNNYCQCYKVTPSPDAYTKVMEIFDD